MLAVFRNANSGSAVAGLCLSSLSRVVELRERWKDAGGVQEARSVEVAANKVGRATELHALQLRPERTAREKDMVGDQTNG